MTGHSSPQTHVYPENLLIRFNTDEASTNFDAANRNRRLQVNLRMEVEYLCEFKELAPEVRYPVQRDPILLTFGSTNVQNGANKIAERKVGTTSQQN